MKIETIKVGELRTNTYIVEDNKEALVIDPGFEPDKIMPYLKDLQIKYIVLTHGHYDHITDAFLLKEKINAPILLHKDDEADTL